MKRLFALLLVLMMLAFAGCSEEIVHTEALDTLMAVRYEGQSDRMTQLAPQAYWDWYENQGRSIEDLVAYSEGAYYSWVNIMSSQYGEALEVTYTVTDQDDMDSETFAAVVNGLERYGIQSDAVENGRILTVDETIDGSKLTETQEKEYMLVAIEGKDYIVYFEETDTGLTVYFRM